MQTKSKTILMAAVVAMAAFSFLMICDADRGESDAATYDIASYTAEVGDPVSASCMVSSHNLPIGAAITLSGNPSWLVADNGAGSPVTYGYNGIGGVHLKGTATSAGNYTIYASVAGSTWVYKWNLTITSPPAPTVIKPVASFTYAFDGDLKVKFSDTSTNTPTSWTWAFGDGTSSTAKSPTKTYAAAGTYNVTLTATNSAGSGSHTRAVTVNATPGATACTVTYDTDGGTAITAAETTVGATITLPAATKANKTFTGWYVGASFVGNAGSNYAVTGNATLTAHWADQTTTKYTVTFFHEGRALSSQDVVSGGKATDPGAPASGKFKGWATSNGTAYNFNTPVTANLNLYAQYEPSNIWDNNLIMYALIGLVVVLLIVAIARTIG